MIKQNRKIIIIRSKEKRILLHKRYPRKKIKFKFVRSFTIYTRGTTRTFVTGRTNQTLVVYYTKRRPGSQDFYEILRNNRKGYINRRRNRIARREEQLARQSAFSKEMLQKEQDIIMPFKRILNVTRVFSVVFLFVIAQVLWRLL